MSKSLSWFDVCFHYGGRSNAVGDITRWSNHRAFKLRIKKGAFSAAGELWVSNNRKFIRLKRRVVSWGWRDRGVTKNSINWPQYVLSLDGETFGNVEYGTYDQATNSILIEWWDVLRGGGYGKERAASRWTPALVFKQKLPDASTRRFWK